jgi:carbamoyltransferase
VAVFGDKLDGMNGAQLGPEFGDEEIESFLRSKGAHFHRMNTREMIDQTARWLADEKVVGWFQGRMEFGPRALGNRSILGDPRSSRMQAVMNLKIKFRESFRPFAPSVLRESVADYFDLDAESPYMLLVAPVVDALRIEMTEEQRGLFGIDKLNVPRSSIPAVTHVDYSARIQTVRREHNALYYDLISAFKRLTGCAVLVNTSFNVRGEPIVCTPEQAYTCFMRTGMDHLVLGNCVLSKHEQAPAKQDQSWQEVFQLD